MNPLPRRSFLAGIPTVGLLSNVAHSFDEAPLQNIVFGSCLNTHDHPMLDRALSLPRDLFIFMGDNIYADKGGLPMMKEKYALLKGSRFFKALRAQGAVIATWDDHDFGENDGGSSYRFKRESQQAFWDWLDEPVESPRRKRAGVYDAHLYGPIGKRVQVIMLDTRYFRSELRKISSERTMLGGPYTASNDRDATMLGEAQWQWLENQLTVPAEIRLIVSSIQFIPEVHGGECWANMPHEQQRMLELIKRSRAGQVVFLSGDRHWCEFSRFEGPMGYPLHDFTSSSLTQKHPRGTPTSNKHRFLPTTYHQPNVGHLQIDWKTSTLLVSIVGEDGDVKIDHRLKLTDLTPS